MREEGIEGRKEVGRERGSGSGEGRESEGRK